MLGALLPRRQECPASAFLSMQAIRQMHDAAPHDSWNGPVPDASQQKRLPLISLSHFWRTKQHPDPHGETLQLLGAALRRWMPEYEAHGYPDMDVFIDWCSCYQEPRSEVEQSASFELALMHINMWYAHALTTVWVVSRPPVEPPQGFRPYHERGWTTFEYQLGSLATTAACANVWAQIVDVSEVGEIVQPAPASPWAFEEGGAFGGLTFTNGADRQRVAHKFRQTMVDVLSAQEELNYALHAWGQAEVEQLAISWPLCTQLRRLDLSRTKLTALPDTIGSIASLEELRVNWCTRLVALPESLSSLRSLRVLELRLCKVPKLPDSIGSLMALVHLDLHSCVNLTALPASFGALGSLETLDLHGTRIELADAAHSLLGLLALRWLDLGQPKRTRLGGEEVDESIRAALPGLRYFFPSCGGAADHVVPLTPPQAPPCHLWRAQLRATRALQAMLEAAGRRL